jgi:2-C-methyl-D-erythritol 4-phosphate cytidylyltransferase/2-C-methyl-D-erythritol 2,4-cyclodiphosphate synthase
MIAAIIAAAGSGERFGAAIPKALIQLGDRTLIEHAVSAISSVADQIIVTAPSGYEKEIQTLYKLLGRVKQHTHPTPETETP